jgi:hypothetical protein
MDTALSVLPLVCVSNIHQRVWLGYWDIAHLIDSLSGRDNDYNSLRIASGDSDSLVRVSSVSGGVQTGPTNPALGQFIYVCGCNAGMYASSSASLRVKCATPES